MDTLQSASDVLFQQAACGLVATDADGIILCINATALAWLGYAPDEADALAGTVRMCELLTVGARLFHHTRCLPLLESGCREAPHDLVAAKAMDENHRDRSRTGHLDVVSNLNGHSLPSGEIQYTLMCVQNITFSQQSQPLCDFA